MIIVELQYFPTISYISTLYNKTHVYLDIYEPYRKMSFRNRCVVAGAQGVISLSVPLEDGRNQRLPVNAVMISNSELWQSRHLKTLQSAYKRSPFFEYYEEGLRLLFEKPAGKLAEWNLTCMDWLKKQLGWPAEIMLTEKAIPFQSPDVEDRRDQVLPKNYTEWDHIRYRQVFEERTGFLPNLSILDLLFNLGPETRHILMGRKD